MCSGRVKEGQPMRGKAVMLRGIVVVPFRVSRSCFRLQRDTLGNISPVHKVWSMGYN